MSTETPPPAKDPAQTARDEAQAAKDAAQAAHYALLEELDTHATHKTFRSPTWKPNQRRNKNIRTILGDAQRREAAAANASNSATATPAVDDGAATPADDNGLSTSGASTPAAGAGAPTPQQENLAQASRSLSKLVLEKSLRAGGQGQAMPAAAPSATYTNVESAPSLAPQRRYCDITGLRGNYADPKTRLRYHNAEVFGLIRALPQGYAERYLEARGAHTVLK